jgi:hypothetical protein
MMFEKMLDNPYHPQNQTYNPAVGVGAVTVLTKGTQKKSILLLFFLYWNGDFNFVAGDSAFETKLDNNQEEVALAPPRRLPVR